MLMVINILPCSVLILGILLIKLSNFHVCLQCQSLCNPKRMLWYVIAVPELWRAIGYVFLPCSHGRQKQELSLHDSLVCHRWSLDKKAHNMLSLGVGIVSHWSNPWDVFMVTMHFDSAISRWHSRLPCFEFNFVKLQYYLVTLAWMHNRNGYNILRDFFLVCIIYSIEHCWKIESICKHNALLEFTYTTNIWVWCDCHVSMTKIC